MLPLNVDFKNVRLAPPRFKEFSIQNASNLGTSFKMHSFCYCRPL